MRVWSPSMHYTDSQATSVRPGRSSGCGLCSRQRRPKLGCWAWDIRPLLCKLGRRGCHGTLTITASRTCAGAINPSSTFGQEPSTSSIKHTQPHGPLLWDRTLPPTCYYSEDWCWRWPLLPCLQVYRTVSISPAKMTPPTGFETSVDLTNRSVALWASFPCVVMSANTVSRVDITIISNDGNRRSGRTWTLSMKRIRNHTTVLAGLQISRQL
jgi:hypothetical protein